MKTVGNLDSTQHLTRFMNPQIRTARTRLNTSTSNMEETDD